MPLISSAPRNTLYDRLAKEPASGVVHEWPTWTVSGMARPWKFGTVLRRTRENLASISGDTRKIAAQRVLVLSDRGKRNFTGLTVNDSRPEWVGRPDDKWIAEYWEPAGE